MKIYFDPESFRAERVRITVQTPRMRPGFREARRGASVWFVRRLENGAWRIVPVKTKTGTSNTGRLFKRILALIRQGVP